MPIPMRLVAAIAVVVVVGVAAFSLFRPSSGVGGVATPPPTLTPSAPAPSPSPQPTANANDPTTWTAYTSDRYGFTVSHPADWTVRPATHNWTSPTDGMTNATEGFIAPGQAVLVSAWSVAVTPGTTADTWIQAYCPKSTEPCTGIKGRSVAESLDGHAGVLVPFTNDVHSFFLINNRMYVVAEWRPNADRTVSIFGGGQKLVENYLSTMHLLPGGPAASASPRPS